MTKYEIVTDELDKLGVFNNKLNETALKMVKVLGDDIPFHMSLTIANYTMASYIGHFHYKIKFASDNLVPPNIIAFVLAKSGAKKTSSMLTLEKTLKTGYEIIQNHRVQKEKIKAEENDATPRPINPLSNALATEAGMIQRLNDFAKEGIGLPAMFVDEISTELATNADMIPNIKLVAQLFDVGEMKSKPLKDREMQSEEVVGMGMTALFMGSEHGILEDDTTLKKFETEFISKLSRRCFFVYPEFIEEEVDLGNIDELLDDLDEKTDSSKELMSEINKLSSKIALDSIEEDENIINIDDDAMRLYKIYKIYCEEKSRSILDEALNLEQQHRHWKAFKLSGVYAKFNSHDSIKFQDLCEAINTAELTSKDLGKFINKAKRETYEIMVEHFLSGGLELSVHEMVKMGWIKKQSNIKDMVINANSKLGTEGIISEFGDKVLFERYQLLDIEGEISASWKMLEPLNTQKYIDAGMDEKDAYKKAKNERGWKINDGFKHKKTQFEKLGNLLKNDCAYTPFKFKSKDEGGIWNPDVTPIPEGGIRNKDNICTGAEFIVLDIDDSDITIHEAFDMLQDYRFLMATTSNKDNIYKFRVIIPLDVIIDVDRTKWKLFMQLVAEHLGMKIDNLPQSQIYYGFSDREVLYNEEGDNLEASEIIKRITEPVKKIVSVPRGILTKIWDDRRNEFAYAYNIKSGQGLHLSLFKAMKHAFDLGFSYEENCGLTQDIMNYIEDKPRANFIESLESQRLQAYGKDKYDD